jgi:hypothetical protein
VNHFSNFTPRIKPLRHIVPVQNAEQIVLKIGAFVAVLQVIMLGYFKG